MKPPVFTFDGHQVVYEPLEVLIDRMRQKLFMPYRSHFSFLPLIRKMQERVESTDCEMTAQMLPQVRELEQHLYHSNGEMDEEIRTSIEALTKMLLPSMYFEGEYGYISPPFAKEFLAMRFDQRFHHRV